MMQEGILRARLRESNPALHGCLERCWKVALEGWLDAVDVNMGSSNSYPHLRNVESHLDQIITGFEGATDPRFRPSLNPVEMYLLLSAVLFHDIGRTQSDWGGHGQIGARFVGTNFAHLGIPSIEFARALAGIIDYQSTPRVEVGRSTIPNITTTVIDPK